MKSNIKCSELAITSSLVLPTLFIGLFLLSSPSNADGTASANASVTVAEACSMSTTNTTPHSTTMVNNDTAENVGVTTFTATCNDPGGLAIYAIGYSNDEYGNTNMIGSLGNIATGTNDSSSNWSMKLMNTDGYTAPDFLQSTYTAVPSTYTKVASKNSNTTDATSFGVSATYRFHTSATQAADTYVGKVKYTMIHPATKLPQDGPMSCNSGKICYSPSANDVVGTMADQNIASEVTLLPSNFSRTGYGFAGWSDKYDYATNPEAKFYGPIEDITLNTADYTGTNPGLSLYAVWVKSQGSLQDSTKVASVCNSLTAATPDITPTLSSISALTDQRDNNTYAIARLADGKCWMIENMRLDNTPELSSTNTNNPSLPLTNNYAESTTSNHLSASINPTTTAWCNSNFAACDDQSMLYTGNTTERGTNPATGANTYSYGNYYNWYSATAGNGKHVNGSGYTAPGDICPSGWKLPLGNTSTGDIEQGESDAANRVGGFSYLDRKMGGTGQPQSTAADSLRWRKYPVNFLYSGLVYSGSVSYRGSRGYYWPSTADNSSFAYGLSLLSSYVNPGTYSGNKYFGRSIRCLMGS